jgi:hypothetical protein
MVKKFPKVKIYVEGGGDTDRLRSMLRQGMREFLKQLKLKRMPAIVTGGHADDTWKRFCKALEDDVDIAILLLDSEETVCHPSPWEHLQNRKENKCNKPAKATDKQCHLMVQCMESWFLADIDQLKTFYGKNFKTDALTSVGIENVNKKKILDDLKKATKDTQKKAYNKGDHSFEILGKIDPEKVKQAGPWAERFFETLKEYCDVDK